MEESGAKKPLWQRMGERPDGCVWGYLLRGGFVMIAPLLIILCGQVISQQGVGAALRWMIGHAGAVGLTWLLLACLMAVLAGVSRLVSLACLLTALLPTALTVISYYKQVINGEPLMLTDFSLAGQFGQVAGFALDRITLSVHTWIALLGLLVLLVAAVALDSKAPRISWRRELCLAGAAGVLLAGSLWAMGSVYCPKQYRAHPLQAERDQACGVPLSLLCAALGNRAAVSEDYGEARMEQLLQEMRGALPDSGGERPHIIFVMNESFFDITRLDGLSFDRDPLENYHRLCGEGSDFGRFYSVTTGGGTGWVEMETFTGIPKDLLKPDRANTDLEAEEYEALPSYVRALRDNGYETIAFHAHTSEMYNRSRNYPHIGFDQVLFYEEYAADATYAGGYFDDNSTADVLISLFEERGEAPLYLYAMTMQNHQPYYAGRYEEDRVKVSSDVLTDKELEVVQCYVNGLYDADQMLGRLTDYFSQVEEPVVLAFAGDHLPSLYLEETASVYSRLGYIASVNSAHWSGEEYRRMLSTDYLLWRNDGQGTGKKDSSCMAMGARLLAFAGVDTSPYYAWLAEKTEDTLLFHFGELWVAPDGAVIQAEEKQESFWAACGDVVYDLLYGENYLQGRAGEVSKTG